MGALLTFEDLTLGYERHPAVHHLHGSIQPGSLTAVVGPNGAGKSTLLKILGGIVPIRGGTRTEGLRASIGYFSQQRAETLDLKSTVLQESMTLSRGVSEQTARTLLGSFLFRGDDVFKPVGVLSGGEKSRLALVKLLLAPPNLLLLDEPTTHLDLASIDALVTALKQYEGSLIFVSHDVFFIRSLADTVLHVHAGQLTPYAGGYDYYLEKSQVGSEREGLVAPLSNAQPQEAPLAVERERKGPGLREQKAAKRAAMEARMAEAKGRKELETAVKRCEAEIARLEALQQDLANQLEDPATYGDAAKPMALNRELLGVAESLERVTRDWEAAAEKLEAFTAKA